MAEGPTGVPDDGLDDELRALGRSLTTEPVRADLAESVLARLHDDPAPAGHPRAPAEGRDLRPRLAAWWERQVARRWRIAVAVLVAALLALVVGSPASARIAEWFGFGGIVVVQRPSAPPLTPVDPADQAGTAERLTLSEVRERVPFELVVPAELGDPDSIEITTDRRVVSMLWREGGTPTGEVRLDQFVGTPDPVMIKTIPEAEFTTVGTAGALWLDGPHPLGYLDQTGAERTESARTSGPALVWQRAAVTLRLEGVADRDRAVDIAESVGR